MVSRSYLPWITALLPTSHAHRTLGPSVPFGSKQRGEGLPQGRLGLGVRWQGLARTVRCAVPAMDGGTPPLLLFRNTSRPPDLWSFAREAGNQFLYETS